MLYEVITRTQLRGAVHNRKTIPPDRVFHLQAIPLTIKYHRHLGSFFIVQALSKFQQLPFGVLLRLLETGSEGFISEYHIESVNDHMVAARHQ